MHFNLIPDSFLQACYLWPADFYAIDSYMLVIDELQDK